jgi:hypothetical protein
VMRSSDSSFRSGTVAVNASGEIDRSAPRYHVPYRGCMVPSDTEASCEHAVTQGAEGACQLDCRGVTWTTMGD